MKNTLTAKLSSRALSFVVVLALLSFGISASFADDNPPSTPSDTAITLVGNGTSENPYQISDCEQLQAVSQDLTSNYVLTADIDCSQSGSLNGDDGFSALGNFTGAFFDGRDHIISNLTLSGEAQNFGLFASIGSDSTVKNLHLENFIETNSYHDSDNDSESGIITGTNDGHIENVDVLDSHLTATGTIGGVVGTNTGTINKVQVDATMTSTGSDSFVIGGLVGTSSGAISNVAADGSIISSNGSPTCGGIAGVVNDSTITTSYANVQIMCANISGQAAGGIVGRISGSQSAITESFSLSTPDGGFHIDGAIVGANPDGLSFPTTYFYLTGGQINCDGSGDTSCTAISNDDNYFVNNMTNAPLDTWDFINSWTPETGLPDILLTHTVLTPFAPTNVTTAIDGSTINIYWSDSSINDTGTSITGYHVEYSTDNWATYSVIEITNSNPGAAIFDSDPHLEYLIRVSAENSAGIGFASNPITVNAVPAAVDSLTVDHVLSRSVTLHWTNQSEFSHITAFTLQYKKASDSQWSNYTLHSLDSDPVIQPLDKLTDYQFQVAAVDDRGTGDFSPVADATTQDQIQYSISSCQDLQNMDNDHYGYYVLAQDIDCSDTANWNSGSGFSPVASSDPSSPFSGTLDGQGHTITNLTVDRVGQISGLFGFTNDATIENLNLIGGSLHRGEPAQGTVYIDEDVSAAVGGIAAIAIGSTINNVTTNISIPSNITVGNIGAAGGLIGMALPDTTGSLPTTITHSHALGDVSGISSGGLIGAILPINVFDMSQSDATSLGILNYVTGSVGLIIDDVSSSSNVSCLAACGGIIGADAASSSLTNATSSGIIGSNNIADAGLDGPTGISDLITSVLLSSPMSGGLIGISLPVSTGTIPASLLITNSGSTATVKGLAAGGVVGLSLPALTLDLANFNPTEMLNGIFGNTALSTDNVTSSATIECSLFCGGVAALSLSNISVNNTTTSGTITNDNAALVASNSSFSTCPLQVSGGFVGMQLLMPLAISNSSSSANITTSQVGTPPAGSIGEVFSNFDPVTDICSIVETLQGSGGAVGTYFNPVNVASIVSMILGSDPSTLGSDSAGLNISNTHTTGTVTTNVGAAAGGLAGLVFGNATINNTSASGDVSNSSLFNLTNPDFASGSTGGLIGTTLGGIEPGVTDGVVPVNVTNSSASGNIYSNNSAGGLIGSIAGLTSVSRSFATGNVHGTSAGGLVGGGVTYGFPWGALGMFGSTEIHDVFAKGNVYASDNPDVVSIAGGLLGGMTYLGDFHLSNAYSSGNVSIENNATDTNSIVGGLAGGIIDMSDYAAQIMGINDPSGPVLSLLSQYGLTVHNDISVSNSFTTSHVVASHNQTSAYPLSIDPTAAAPSIMSGSLFGIIFATNLSQGTSKTPASFLSGLYYDGTQSHASQCASTLDSSLLNSNDGPTMFALDGSLCNEVNSDGTDANHFVNTTSVAPVSAWDFTNTWFSHPSDLPTLTPTVPDPSNDDHGTPPVDGGHTNNGGVTPTTTPPTTTTPEQDPVPGNVFTKQDPITPEQVITVIGGTASVLPDTPAKDILPEVLGEVEQKVSPATPKKDDTPKETGIIGTIIGALSATGIFLAQHILAAIALILLGGALILLSRRKEILAHLRKE